MISTGQIVRRPVKVDFHIHSAASAHKDGSKVKENTIDNVDVLFSRLEENEVNMVAITDHDCFDYGIYKALRSKIQHARHLQRVLPGVEFSVCFATADGEKPVHVITLFDDADQERIKNIASALRFVDGKPAYDAGGAFRETTYWEIIREVGLDIVTIAHQKSSPTSTKRRANDANSVGDDLFNELIAIEYFEAYEYKNRRNELFNRAYSYSIDQQERLRFITGSDCHVWSVYPDYDTHPTPSDCNYSYTFLKCLPTFKGVAMAVTDISRIKTIPSFFSGSDKMLGSIELTLNGQDFSVPLSPGINAIIGDNSIGKSSLLNALTGYEGVTATVRRGQEKYLQSENLTLRATIPEAYRPHFDHQDDIRKLFEGLSNGKARKQLDRHFPAPLESAPFMSYAMGQFEKLILALKSSCDYQSALSDFGCFVLPDARPLEVPESVTFDRGVELDDPSPHNELVNGITDSIVNISNNSDLHSEIVSAEDKADFAVALEALAHIRSRHQDVMNRMQIDFLIANKLGEAIADLESAQSQVVSDAQKCLSEFQGSISRVGGTVANAVKLEHQVRDVTFAFPPMQMKPNVNPVGDLQFICKLAVESISPELLTSLIDSIIGKRKDLNTRTASYESVADAIKNYPEDEDDPLCVLRARFKQALETKLKAVKAINREEDDVYDELSRGYNAQLYFALMADRRIDNGIYIVDQPEDQISQKAIKETVLREFREIAGSRQVILVTHNPQFIVNLDVDNVIYIGRNRDGLYIQSGALEYECDEYRILDVVADNIEGGLDTIQRRMKRYEKTY